ncbi:MAG: 2,3-bisphosphoglycerate-independent phosphoglycerate mutase [Candidatus Eisenbacteria bacterium]|nr:2,3-bisphosphoglycerate-independent phosphoglycerate mutase [Candidatus Eisenbacteria bacterium]
MKASDPRVAEGLIDTSGGKMILLVADGLGGLPHPDSGLTELETAKTPNLDALAGESVCGLHTPIAPGITPGSGPAHMALFGYDPVEYEIGRGVLEALGIDFELKPGDVAIRINFATIDDDGLVTDRRAGRISTEKCTELAERLDGIRVPGVEIMVRPVKEHRGVVVLRGEGLVGGLEDTDPQETGVAPKCVKAETEEQKHTAEVLRAFVSAAAEMLKNEPKANMILMRGIASRDPIPTLTERFGIQAAAIAGYPMYRGVAGLVGMDVLPPAETPEDLVAACRKAYADYDFLFLHFKKTDSTGEDGDFDRKVEASEKLDSILPGVLETDPDVLVVTGDHSTPSALASHSWHPVPVLLRADSARVDAVDAFGESHCLRGGLGMVRAVDLMPLMLAHAGRLDKFGA